MRPDVIASSEDDAPFRHQVADCRCDLVDIEAS